MPLDFFSLEILKLRYIFCGLRTISNITELFLTKKEQTIFKVAPNQDREVIRTVARI
jgi:hypothetical protein